MAAHLNRTPFPNSPNTFAYTIFFIKFLPSIILNATLVGLTLFAIANPAALVAISSPLALSLLPIPPALLRTSLLILLVTYNYRLQFDLFSTIACIFNANSTIYTLLATALPFPIMLGLFSFAPTTFGILYLPALTLIMIPRIALIMVDHLGLNHKTLNKKRSWLINFTRFTSIALITPLFIVFAPTLTPIVFVPLLHQVYCIIYTEPVTSTTNDFRKLFYSALKLSTSFTHTFIDCILIAIFTPLLTPTLPILAPLLPLITASSSFIAQFNPLIFAATCTLINQTLALLIKTTYTKHKNGLHRKVELGLNELSPLYLFFTSLKGLTQDAFSTLSIRIPNSTMRSQGDTVKSTEDLLENAPLEANHDPSSLLHAEPQSAKAKNPLNLFSCLSPATTNTLIY